MKWTRYRPPEDGDEYKKFNNQGAARLDYGFAALLLANIVEHRLVLSSFVYSPRAPPLLLSSGKSRRKEDKPMKYERYESVDGSAYKAEPGKDGISGDDMRVLKRIVKGSQKTEAKVNRLDTVSIELVTEDGWQESDVAVIIEEQDEHERLHTAIATLPPEQQALIHAVYFQGESVASIARREGVTPRAVWNRLERIFKKIKNYLD